MKTGTVLFTVPPQHTSIPAPSQILSKIFSQQHSFTSCFSSGWTQHYLQISGEWHHMSDFGCWKPLEIERRVLGRSLFHIFSSSLKSECMSYLHSTPYPSETHTVTQRDFGSRKEKASKTLHWALKHAKIYQALRMETCQGEAFLGEREADLPKRAVLQGLPSLSTKHEYTDVSHSRPAGFTGPCPFHTTYHFSRCLVSVWWQKTWTGVICHD